MAPESLWTFYLYFHISASHQQQSSDCTVFFFAVGQKYNPIGFIHVPGPVQGLQWSPHSHVSLVRNVLYPAHFNMKTFLMQQY